MYSTAPVQGTIAGLVADKAGDLYLTGYVQSNASNICGYATLHVPIACNHAFVAKLDPSGTRVIYRTTLAGSSEDRGASIALDTEGNAYVLGTTYSADFPVTSGAAQTMNSGPTLNPFGLPGAGGDLFLAKLDTSGYVVYTTFLGGPDNELAANIRVDSGGNVYVSGVSGPHFPVTPDAYLGTGGPFAGIVAKINPSGTKVIWATFVDGGGMIDVDSNGDVYAVNGPSIVKLSPDGKPVTSTSIPLQVGEAVSDLAVDSSGAAWVAGRAGSEAGFVRRFSLDGSGVIFTARSTLISLTHPSIAVDAMGRANVVGFAWQITPTGNAALPYYCPGLIPEFLTVFSPNGRIEYSSYLSTASGTSVIPALAIGNPGQVYTTDGTVLTKTDLDAPQGAVVACAVNAASFSVGRGAEGELISLFGANLGPPEHVGLQLDLNGKVATALGDTRVLINGVPAPLLYVSSTQINTVMPFGVQPGTFAQLAIETGGQVVSALPVPIASVAPGLFTLPSPAGQAAVLNEDGTVNSPQNPAARGSIISLFATALGPFSPPLSDAEVAPAPPSMLSEPIQVYFAGQPGTITFAGSAPGLVAGVVQINARVPSDIPAGVNLNAVLVQVFVNRYGAGTQPGVTVAIK